MSRVRAVLVTADGDLVIIERIRAGVEPYWILPGGGVEAGEELETALARELREELAAAADVHSLLHVLEQGGECHYFYLARTDGWSAAPADRSGPEFADPAHGEFYPRAVPPAVAALAAIDLKPEEFAGFLLGHLRAATDLFTLPDLRAGPAVAS